MTKIKMAKFAFSWNCTFFFFVQKKIVLSHMQIRFIKGKFKVFNLSMTTFHALKRNIYFLNNIKKKKAINEHQVVIIIDGGSYNNTLKRFT